MESILLYIVKMYETFSYYCILLVALVFFSMFPLNNLLIKLEKIISQKVGESASLVRIRKTLSSLLVFALAAIYIYVFCLIFCKGACIEFVMASCVPVAACSMLLRAIYKLVRDNGILPIAKLIAKKSQDILKDIPIPAQLKTVISSGIDEFLKQHKNTLSETDEKELMLKLEKQLNGFCDQANVAAFKIVGNIKRRI